MERLNPLAKPAAVLPAMAVLLFVRDLATPSLFIALGCALVLCGARLTRSTLLLVLVVLPA
ncbi:MAG: energy-coupling factor transporter transmembrane protein EcfT, partial [Microbacterium sp.]